MLDDLITLASRLKNTETLPYHGSTVPVSIYVHNDKDLLDAIRCLDSAILDTNDVSRWLTFKGKVGKVTVLVTHVRRLKDSHGPDLV